MPTTRIVTKLYPRDPKHIRNKLRCDKNARTLNANEEKRYWMINSVYVRVKFLDKHERTSDREVTQWLPFPTVNDSGKFSVGKVRQNDLAFRMNTSSRKVLRECLVSIIVTKPKRERGAELEDEETPEWRGFRAGVDLRLGAIDTTNVNRKRGRKKETIRKVLKQFTIVRICERKYICMEIAWTCDMQNKLYHGLSPIQTYQHTNSLHTPKCMKILL